MDILKLSQISIAIALMVVILLQNRGDGVSGVFGGGGGGGSNSYLTKRGMEKKLFVATIILSVSFFIVSLLSVTL